MRLFRRRGPDLPRRLPLVLPRPDGTGWPDESLVGRPSFESGTWYELGLRHAYDPEAHAVADRLVADVLPALSTGVQPEDAPYLHKVFSTAARVGAGLGIVERGLSSDDDGTVDRRMVASLGAARRALPSMPADWARLAGFFLLAGFHVARTGPAMVDRLAEDVRGGGD